MSVVRSNMVHSNDAQVKAMVSDGTSYTHESVKQVLRYCRCCFYRPTKHGKLAASVLVPRRMLRIWFDLGAHFIVLWDLLMVPDTGITLISSFASLLLFEAYLSHLAVSLNWTFVGLMLAFPLQHGIKEAYNRRETALRSLVDIRSNALNIYLAHAIWNWPGAETYNGRAEDNKRREEGGVGMKKKPCNIALRVDHRDHVTDLLFRLFDGLQEVLLVPRAGHARMEYFCGRRERWQTEHALDMGRREILKIFSRLQRAVEDLKAAGMPATEASRINQYNTLLARDFERLWAAKVYYTPIALRAMLRVVVQLLPFFYGPYWLYVARGRDGAKTTASLLFALCFSCLVSLLLIAMLNLEEQMEDPFRHANRECIRVKQEMDLARQSIRLSDDDLCEKWRDWITFDWESLQTPMGIINDSESERDSLV